MDRFYSSSFAIDAPMVDPWGSFSASQVTQGPIADRAARRAARPSIGSADLLYIAVVGPELPEVGIPPCAIAADEPAAPRRKPEEGIARSRGRISGIMLDGLKGTRLDMTTRIAHCKGTGFSNIEALVADRFGLGQWERVLERLSMRDRAALREVTPSGWYPTDLLFRTTKAMTDLFSEGDDASLLHDLGRKAAKRDLTFVQRTFLRMAHPAYVLEKSSDYWRRFFDRGSWEVERRRTGAVGVLSGFVVDEPFCHVLTGYIGHMFELVGAKNVHVVHVECTSRGAPACVFAGEWS